MEVKEVKKFEVSAKKETVWAFLSDPWKIAPCLPGAQLVDTIGENRYSGKIKVKIGPVTTNFDGEVEFTQLDADKHHFVLEGKGVDKNGKGSAAMQMEMNLSDQEGGTQIECGMSISISGRIAQFGARMITAVNNKMFDQFTKNFQNLLEKHEAGESTDSNSGENVVDAGSVVGSMIKDSVSGIFKKKDS
ncbi:MAG: SRPBCC family protein [SAR324 cluster bacterium]|nr:SRPBCC family protein [SAR324 cluster bacterium]